MPQCRTILACAGVLGLVAVPNAVNAASAFAVPFTPEYWQIAGRVAFPPTEGFPDGRMVMGEGRAVARNIEFRNGTIEYDAKLKEDAFAAIRFRTQGDRAAEIFYLRPDADCPAANDCFQYVPLVHGVWPWEMYPEYQGQAPVEIGRWNHVKLVVSGKRMDVFLNHAPTPILTVGALQADTASGGVELQGPAEFANLTVAPEAAQGVFAPAAEMTDEHFVRGWAVTVPRDVAYGTVPALPLMPAEPAAWAPITAERHGLVNLSRRYGAPTSDMRIGSFAWLRTDIQSDRDQIKHVRFGFLHEAWVYAEGHQVYSGENLYYPEQKRLHPDGRLSLQNASFDLPLHKGHNRIAIALANILGVGHTHYGWGFEFRLDDVGGLVMPRDPGRTGGPGAQ